MAPLSISDDFASIVDGLEEVTLVVAGRADVAVTSAHRNQLAMDDPDQAAGEVRRGSTVWQWPLSETPERPPLGSVIVDDAGNRHTILELAEQVLGSKYSAVTVNLAVKAGLDNLVVIEQATYAKDSHGEAVPTWETIVEDVQARVQPISQQTAIEHGQDATEASCEILLADDLSGLSIDPVGADYRVTDAAGDVYRLDQYVRPERLDALPKLLVRRV